MPDEKTICVVCAWRGSCNKKYSKGASTSTQCPDYTRDVTLVDKEHETTR